MRSLCALAFLLCVAAAEPARPTLGVLDMTVSRGTSSDLVAICNETLRDVAVTAAKYRVQDRAQMEAILKEQKFNGSDACDESCAVEAGRLLQVAYLLSGSVRRLDTTTFVSVRLTDVSTGEVAGTQTESCAQCSAVEVVNAVRGAAGRLLGVERVESVASAQAPTVAPAEAPTHHSHWPMWVGIGCIIAGPIAIGTSNGDSSMALGGATIMLGGVGLMIWDIARSRSEMFPGSQ